MSTPRHVYWSTIGNSSFPHFHLNVAGFSLSSLHTPTAHFFLRSLSLQFLVYSSAFSIRFCNPSGVSDISHEIICKHQCRHCVFLHRDFCFAASTAAMVSLPFTLNRFGDSVHPCACATPCKVSTYFDISPAQHHGTSSAFHHIFLQFSASFL